MSGEERVRIDLIPFIIVLLGLFVGYLFFKLNFFSKKSSPIAFSTLSPWKEEKKTVLEKFVKLPLILMMIALSLLVIAFINPHKLVEMVNTPPPTKGLALYLLLDRSGSMSQKNGPLSKFDNLKLAAKKFIETLPNDLIGVVAFARSADIISPLTLDHKELISKISRLEVVQNKVDDGTSISYAIFKTAHLIEAAKIFQKRLPPNTASPYKMESVSIFVITDGLQDPNPLDKDNPFRSMELEEAANYAKEKEIKVSILNIEPKVLDPKYAPNIRQMEKIARMTGGDFFPLRSVQEVYPLLEKIVKEEKKNLLLDNEQNFYKVHSFSFIFIFGALFFAALSLILNALYFRVVDDLT